MEAAAEALEQAAEGLCAVLELLGLRPDELPTDAAAAAAGLAEAAQGLGLASATAGALDEGLQRVRGV